MVIPEGFSNQQTEKVEIPDSFDMAFLLSPKSLASNFRAVLGEVQKPDFHGIVRFALADNSSAPGLKLARDNNIPSVALPYRRPEGKSAKEYRAEYSFQIGRLLKGMKIDIAVMAGFNRILTQEYFDEFGGPTINIHPGAIPDEKDTPFIFEDGTPAPWNQGMMTETAVANFLPLKFATSTIHIATLEADFGPVLKRVFTRVLPGDDVDSLYARLKIEEHKGLIEVLKNPPLKPT